jgi:sugar lactone lactonase YvrE
VGILVLSAFAFGCTAETSEPSCPDATGVVCTWAGNGRPSFNGDGKQPEQSGLYWPIDLTIDEELGTYILDWNNHRVRQVTEDGTLQTVIGTDFVGDGPADLSDMTPEGAPGTEVTLNHPTQLVPTIEGTLMLVAWHNHKLRSYDPQTGRVTVSCGGPPGFGGDEGPAKMAKLNQPSQLAADDDGNLYVLDQRNQVIRRIDAEGVITTIAGTPTMAGPAEDGAASSCKFSFPMGSNPPPGGGLALDGEGNLYVSDSLNHRIRKVDLEADEITTIAGTGEAGFSGDGGDATRAKINFPRKLTFGPDGRLYFGDQQNHRIRAIDLESGEIATVVGNGEEGFVEDGLPPTETSLSQPTGVTFDADGVMYVLDTFNSRIRRVLPEEGAEP